VERELADRVTALTKANPVDTLGNDLRRLVYTVAGSSLVISPDTGPLHIARALEIPVVGLYGYTNPKRSGPYRLFTDLVVDGYARHPEEDYPINMEYRDGMKRVTVDAVLEKVALAMEKYVT
jgi:heptosyltransferase I